MRWLALLAVGCGPAVPTPPGPPPAPRTPRIVEASLRCDAPSALWTLEVVADAWTGGGVSAWTVDGRYVEVHPVRSVAAAEDGGSDELQLLLPVVADWREAGPGSGTDFSCASDPDVLFVLRDARGEPAGCVQWGPHPDVWETVEGFAPCE